MEDNDKLVNDHSQKTPINTQKKKNCERHTSSSEYNNALAGCRKTKNKKKKVGKILFRALRT